MCKCPICNTNLRPIEFTLDNKAVIAICPSCDKEEYFIHLKNTIPYKKVNGVLESTQKKFTIDNIMNKTVRIKTWDEMLAENSIDSDGDIFILKDDMCFTISMEDLMPSDRIVTLTSNEYKGYIITPSMISAIIEKD